jgi:hypothetical protein
MGADRAQQAAQEGFDLLAARPLGGTKHGRDEAALAVELIFYTSNHQGIDCKRQSALRERRGTTFG